MLLKKVFKFGFISLFLFNICGCVALLAGGAAGAGTAVWLSGKLTQQFNASYERTVNASESALKTLGLGVSKISRDASVTQLRSQYSDGKEIWIDVHKISDRATKVDVRVGGINPDKQAATDILKQIERYI